MTTDILQALTGYQTPKTREQKEFETRLMTCCHCGKQSRDRNVVSTFGYHVGGDSFPRFQEECAGGCK